jgi:hypothetical protein
MCNLVVAPNLIARVGGTTGEACFIVLLRVIRMAQDPKDHLDFAGGMFPFLEMTRVFIIYTLRSYLDPRKIFQKIFFKRSVT